jgi:hypothetical protein
MTVLVVFLKIEINARLSFSTCRKKQLRRSGGEGLRGELNLNGSIRDARVKVNAGTAVAQPPRMVVHKSE